LIGGIGRNVRSNSYQSPDNQVHYDLEANLYEKDQNNSTKYDGSSDDNSRTADDENSIQNYFDNDVTFVEQALIHS